MMRTIYDYKDIRKLEQSLISEELRSGVIVTATSSLATELRSYYPEYTVLGMHELINELIPEWDESTKDLRNYISLRNALDDYAAEKDGNETLFLSLQRNATDIWNAILLLVEADVYPHDIPEGISVPANHFKEIWKRLEIENSALLNLRAQFAFRLSNEDTVISCIESCIKRSYVNDTFDVIKKRFFFLGFYFITPIQARLIDVLSAAGLDIAYLNCHDERYRYAGEIWEKTFNEEYTDNTAIDIQPELSFNNSFGELLNGQDDVMQVDIAKFTSDLEFAQAMKTPITTGASLFTPDIKGCETILKEYYPEYFERKHLLAFPVGQYIYYLHMMWDAFDGRLELRYEYVFKCFATGWLEVGQLNGRDYIYEMLKLAPFFKDCVDQETWRDRLSLLKTVKEYSKEPEVEDVPNRRWHELLGDPFKQVGIYNLPCETIDALEQLITKLIEDAELLFSSEGKVRISDHFDKIKMIINEHMGREDVLDDEIQIAKELVRNLEMAGAEDQECPLSAIKDAIVLLIGGHFDEVDTLDQELSLIEDRVAPLSTIESSLLSNHGEDIYLVLADEFTLPGRPRDLPWPLTDELLDSLHLESREDTRRYVAHMRSVIKNRPLSYRYLFFSFISNVNEENHPSLHLSWIKNQGNRTAATSPYVMMMWPEVSAREDSVSPIDFEEEIEKIKINDPSLDIAVPPEGVPEEVSIDYELCEYRYLYSYLLNYLPEYRTEFHYQFLLTELINYYYSVTGENKAKITENMKALFPFFLKIERQQSSDYSKNKRISDDPLTFDDVEFPVAGLNIHYLQARTIALRVLGGGRVRKKDQRTICIYCPYSEICIYKKGKHLDQ